MDENERQRSPEFDLTNDRHKDLKKERQQRERQTSLKKKDMRPT